MLNNEEQIEIEDCNKLTQDQQNQASLYVDNMRRTFQPGHILQSMDLILFHSETDMPIYVKGSPLLEKVASLFWLSRLLISINQKPSMEWRACHACWYASLLGYESIGKLPWDHQLKRLQKT